MSLFSHTPAQPAQPAEPAELPPIDRDQPEAVATATFALG
jgi:hypothetical protein